MYVLQSLPKFGEPLVVYQIFSREKRFSKRHGDTRSISTGPTPHHREGEEERSDQEKDLRGIQEMDGSAR